MTMCADFPWWLCSSFRGLAAEAERHHKAQQTFSLPGLKLRCEAVWTSQGCCVSVVEIVCEEAEHVLSALAKACKLVVCEPQICEVHVHCPHHSELLLSHGFSALGAGIDQFLLQPSTVCGTYGYGEDIHALHAAADTKGARTKQPPCMLCSKESVKTVVIPSNMAVPLGEGAYNMCDVCSSFWTWPTCEVVRE